MNRCRIKIIDIIREHWNDFKKYKGNKLPKDIRNDIYESVEKAIYCGNISKKLPSRIVYKIYYY